MYTIVLHDYSNDLCLFYLGIFLTHVYSEAHSSMVYTFVL